MVETTTAAASAAIDPATIQAFTGLLTAIVAVLGIFVSFMTVRLTKQQNEHNREAAKQQFELTQQQIESNQQEARNNRFTSAIEHLKDDSLAIRMGALCELEVLCLDSKEQSEKLVSILACFVREHIESKKWLCDPMPGKDLKRIDQDVYSAGEIISKAFVIHGIRAKLSFLTAENLNLKSFKLQGANLRRSRFNGSYLGWAELQDTLVGWVQLKNTTLVGTHFERADFTWFYGNRKSEDEKYLDLNKNKLLDAIRVEDALLDPEIRAEYDRLKAEREKTEADS